MITIFNRLIPFPGFKALTMWPFIFVRRGTYYGNVTENHERIHAQQQKEMLVMPFFVWYVMEWLLRSALSGRNAYRDISFEREAYANERNLDYLCGRKFFQWIKYIKR